MNTVYAIYVGNYEPFIYMVCSTPEKANEEKEKLYTPDLAYTNVYIEPFELDKVRVKV